MRKAEEMVQDKAKEVGRRSTMDSENIPPQKKGVLSSAVPEKGPAAVGQEEAQAKIAFSLVQGQTQKAPSDTEGPLAPRHHKLLSPGHLQSAMKTWQATYESHPLDVEYGAGLSLLAVIDELEKEEEDGEGQSPASMTSSEEIFANTASRYRSSEGEASPCPSSSAMSITAQKLDRARRNLFPMPSRDSDDNPGPSTSSGLCPARVGAQSGFQVEMEYCGEQNGVEANFCVLIPSTAAIPVEDLRETEEHKEFMSGRVRRNKLRAKLQNRPLELVVDEVDRAATKVQELVLRGIIGLPRGITIPHLQMVLMSGRQPLHQKGAKVLVKAEGRQWRGRVRESRKISIGEYSLVQYRKVSATDLLTLMLKADGEFIYCIEFSRIAHPARYRISPFMEFFIMEDTMGPKELMPPYRRKEPWVVKIRTHNGIKQITVMMLTDEKKNLMDGFLPLTSDQCIISAGNANWFLVQNNSHSAVTILTRKIKGGRQIFRTIGYFQIREWSPSRNPLVRLGLTPQDIPIENKNLFTAILDDIDMCDDPQYEDELPPGEASGDSSDSGEESDDALDTDSIVPTDTDSVYAAPLPFDAHFGKLKAQHLKREQMKMNRPKPASPQVTPVKRADVSQSRVEAMGNLSLAGQKEISIDVTSALAERAVSATVQDFKEQRRKERKERVDRRVRFLKAHKRVISQAGKFRRKRAEFTESVPPNSPIRMEILPEKPHTEPCRSPAPSSVPETPGMGSRVPSVIPETPGLADSPGAIEKPEGDLTSPGSLSTTNSIVPSTPKKDRKGKAMVKKGKGAACKGVGKKGKPEKKKPTTKGNTPAKKKLTAAQRKQVATEMRRIKAAEKKEKSEKLAAQKADRILEAQKSRELLRAINQRVAQDQGGAVTLESKAPPGATVDEEQTVVIAPPVTRNVFSIDLCDFREYRNTQQVIASGVADLNVEVRVLTASQEKERMVTETKLDCLLRNQLKLGNVFSAAMTSPPRGSEAQASPMSSLKCFPAGPTALNAPGNPTFLSLARNLPPRMDCARRLDLTGRGPVMQARSDEKDSLEDSGSGSVAPNTAAGHGKAEKGKAKSPESDKDPPEKGDNGDTPPPPSDGPGSPSGGGKREGDDEDDDERRGKKKPSSENPEDEDDGDEEEVEENPEEEEEVRAQDLSSDDESDVGDDELGMLNDADSENHKRLRESSSSPTPSKAAEESQKKEVESSSPTPSEAAEESQKKEVESSSPTPSEAAEESQKTAEEDIDAAIARADEEAAKLAEKVSTRKSDIARINEDLKQKQKEEILREKQALLAAQKKEYDALGDRKAQLTAKLSQHSRSASVASGEAWRQHSGSRSSVAKLSDDAGERKKKKKKKRGRSRSRSSSLGSYRHPKRPLQSRSRSRSRSRSKGQKRARKGSPSPSPKPRSHSRSRSRSRSRRQTKKRDPILSRSPSPLEEAVSEPVKEKPEKRVKDKPGKMPVKEKPVKDKAGEGKAGKQKPVKDKAREDKAGKEKPVKDKAREDKAEKEKPVKDKAGEDKAGEDKAGKQKPGNSKTAATASHPPKDQPTPQKIMTKSEAGRSKKPAMVYLTVNPTLEPVLRTALCPKAVEEGALAQSDDTDDAYKRGRDFEPLATPGNVLTNPIQVLKEGQLERPLEHGGIRKTQKLISKITFWTQGTIAKEIKSAKGPRPCSLATVVTVLVKNAVDRSKKSRQAAMLKGLTLSWDSNFSFRDLIKAQPRIYAEALTVALAREYEDLPDGKLQVKHPGLFTKLKKEIQDANKRKSTIVKLAVHDLGYTLVPRPRVSTLAASVEAGHVLKVVRAEKAVTAVVTRPPDVGRVMKRLREVRAAKKKADERKKSSEVGVGEEETQKGEDSKKSSQEEPQKKLKEEESRRRSSNSSSRRRDPPGSIRHRRSPARGNNSPRRWRSPARGNNSPRRWRSPARGSNSSSRRDRSPERRNGASSRRSRSPVRRNGSSRRRSKSPLRKNESSLRRSPSRHSLREVPPKRRKKSPASRPILSSESDESESESESSATSKKVEQRLALMGTRPFRETPPTKSRKKKKESDSDYSP